jgi:hypothetical protein
MQGNGDLDTRVARLEREARVWRAAAALLLLVATAAWVVPSASAQSGTQTLTADTIVARQIYVALNPASALTTAGGLNSSISLTAGPNANSLSMTGPNNATPTTGPFVSIFVGGQTATVSASNLPTDTATMGLQANSPVRFAVYDTSVSQTDPVWTAP